MKRIILSVVVGLAGLACLLATYSVAGSVKLYLDDASKVTGGGWPYAVCFGVAGLSASAIVIYAGIRSLTRWSTLRFLKLIRIALIACIVMAVVSTVWFIALTGLFNAIGVIGLTASLFGGALGLKVLSLMESDYQACRAK